jgi:phage shock protein PspC (stress-responsive transcriptional regulator)
MSERPPAAPSGEQAPSPPPPPIEPPPPAAPPPPSAPPPPAALPPGPAPAPGTVRRLTRRTDNKILAGVASGIAAYLGIEPWIVRIGFVILVPFGGFGLLAYLIAWLLVPVEGSQQSLAGDVLRRPPSGLRGYLGVALILLAVAILASAFSEPGVIWAIVLIAFGIFLFRQDDPADRPPPPGPGGPGGPGGYGGPGGPGGPGGYGGPGGPGPGGAGGPGLAAASATTPLPATTTPLPAATGTTAPLPAAPGTATTEPLGQLPPAPGQGTMTLPPDVPVWEPPPPPDRTAAWGGAPPPRPPRRRPFLGPVTFAVALIATGLALALNNLDVLDLSVGQVLAVFLTVLGGGLLVGTWWGRAWGLIPIGLLAVPVVAVAALAGPVPVEGGVAERLYQPTTPAEIRSPYRLAGGELIVDLSRVDFGPGAPPVQASVAGGRLLVVLPDEVTADVRGRVGVGALDLLGHVDTGAQVNSAVAVPPAKPPAKGAAPTVRLDLMVGYGVIEVRRASDPRPLHEAGPFEDSFSGRAIPAPAPTATTEAP